MTSLFFIRARAADFWTQLILTQFQWVVISSPLKAFGSSQRDDFKLEKVTGVLGNLLCLSRWKCVVTPKGDTYKFNRASVSPLKAASTIHKPGNTNSIFPGQHNCNRLKSVCLFLHSCGCMQVWMAVSLFLAFWFYMNLLMEFMEELIIIWQWTARRTTRRVHYNVALYCWCCLCVYVFSNFILQSCFICFSPAVHGW